MNQVSISRVVRTQMVHTLVPHISPDTEALCMGYSINSKAVVRKALNCIDRLRLKFIPAGPLRKKDWNEERTVCSKELEEKRGYLFLDCGGGRFDQHVLPDSVSENKTASLHLLLEELHARAEKMDADDRRELLQFLKIMEGVFLVICKNDLTGEDIAPRSLDAKPESSEPSQDADDLVADMVQDMDIAEPVEGKTIAQIVAEEDPTPHTPRHLRNMILGWNVLYPNDPEKVFALASVAFGSIEQNVRMLYENSDAQELDVRKLFRLDEILYGTEAHFAAVMPGASEGQIKHEARLFAAQAEKSLREMERQWHVAVGDFWRNASGRFVDMLPQVEGKKRRRIAVLVGRSESQRFGQVARRGNTEPYDYRKREATGTRPEPQMPRRPKSDVVIQMYGRGLFVISSKDGIKLDRVASALREADLRKQDVEITPKVKAQLPSPGNFAYRNRKGVYIEAIYFPNYRGAVGNYFRANPCMPRTALTEAEICNIVVATLATPYSVDTSEVIDSL